MYWAELLTVALIHLLPWPARGRISPSWCARAPMVAAPVPGRHWAWAPASSSMGLFAARHRPDRVAVHRAVQRATKWLAATYLFYIGIKALRAKPAAPGSLEVVGDGAERSPRGAFMTGFVTNGLNPKATLFFLSCSPW